MHVSSIISSSNHQAIIPSSTVSLHALTRGYRVMSSAQVVVWGEYECYLRMESMQFRGDKTSFGRGRHGLDAGTLFIIVRGDCEKLIVYEQVTRMPTRISAQ